MRSRKCECLFRLHGYLSKFNKWSLSIVNGVHNHSMDPKLKDHLIASRVAEKEKENVDDLMNLKDKRTDNLTNIKQIYNARQRYKK